MQIILTLDEAERMCKRTIIECNNFVIDSSYVSVRIENMQLSNKIALIKMARRLASDILNNIVPTNPQMGSVPACIGLAEAKLWVEKYMSENM